MPAPSKRSGTTTPSAPSRPSARNASRGKACSRSHRAACGAISSCANVRIVSRSSCCSSLSRIESASFFPRESRRQCREHAYQCTLRPTSPAGTTGEKTAHACGGQNEQRIAQQCDRHLRRREHEALRQHVPLRGRHELRKECELEKRDFRIQDCGEDRKSVV